MVVIGEERRRMRVTLRSGALNGGNGCDSFSLNVCAVSFFISCHRLDNAATVVFFIYLRFKFIDETGEDEELKLNKTANIKN